MRTDPRILALCVLMTGCGQSPDPRFCTAIAVDAMTVTVTDAATGQRICDATVIAIDGAFSADLRPFASGPECSYSGPTERAGRYEVRVTRSGYETAVRRDVTVTADECHVIPVLLSFALRPL